VKLQGEDVLLVILALYPLNSGWNHLSLLDQIVTINSKQIKLKCILPVSGLENISFFLLKK